MSSLNEQSLRKQIGETILAVILYKTTRGRRGYDLEQGLDIIMAMVLAFTQEKVNRAKTEGE